MNQMHKLTATVHALFPVDAKKPIFADTPVYKALAPLAQTDETAKGLLAKAEAEFLAKHGENLPVQIRVACANLLALLSEGEIATQAREAEKLAFSLRGKVSLSMVEIRLDIFAAYKDKLPLSPTLRAILAFAEKVDDGTVAKDMAKQKELGDKLGLTEDCRKAAFVIGEGGGMRLKEGDKELSLLSLLYLCDGRTEDGDEIKKDKGKK